MTRSSPIGSTEDDLVPLLDECPGSPEQWRRFLDTVSGRFGTSFSGFTRYEHVERSDVSLSVGADDTYVAAYHQHWCRVNPWTAAADRRIANGVVLPTEAYVPERELLASEFYNDFLHKERLGHHGVAGHIQSGNETVHLSLIRQKRQGAFDEREVGELTRLLPLIRNAVANDRAAAEIRATSRAIVDTLDTLAYGIIVLGRTVWLNAWARQMIARHPRVFSVAAETLRIGSVPADKALQRRIAQARSPRVAVDGPFVLRIDKERAVSITVVARFNGSFWARTRPPLILIRECQPSSLLADRLIHDLGLTRREADLVVALRTGERLRDVAELLGVTVATARVHLASAFRKTSTHSQTALMAEVARVADGT